MCGSRSATSRRFGWKLRPTHLVQRTRRYSSSALLLDAADWMVMLVCPLPVLAARSDDEQLPKQHLPLVLTGCGSLIRRACSNCVTCLFRARPDETPAGESDRTTTVSGCDKTSAPPTDPAVCHIAPTYSHCMAGIGSKENNEPTTAMESSIALYRFRAADTMSPFRHML